MTENGLFQLALLITVVIALVYPLGIYIARVYQGQSPLIVILGPVERFIYRCCGINPNSEMHWKSYATQMLLMNFTGLLFVYAMLRLQAFLPLNPQQLPALPADLSFNIAASFVTNTNWQSYSPETTVSYFSQMLALTVQNFLSAASGLCVLVALIRGFSRQKTSLIGNYWVDLVRSVLYLLLPLALLFSLILVSEGVIQNLKPNLTYTPLTTLMSQTAATPPPTATLPMGPVASQVAIKVLGSNGGGFFNVNSAHPFENPTPLSQFLQLIGILLIPAALCATFGVLIKDQRQGWTILITMLVLLVPLMLADIAAESMINVKVAALGVQQSPENFGASFGNMEGKETRFGIVGSALFATATTATSNGSVNSMLDSFTPIGGLIPLWLMQLSESVFGGVGSGLMSMLMFILMTVFIAGLMVGRTPEYLGKKIEPYEMKMVSFAIVILPCLTLVATALALMLPIGRSAVANAGPHGFTEIFYAFTSMANNNGSAFAGLNANQPFFNTLGGIVMLIGRYTVAIAVLAIAGSLAQKKLIPRSLGTLPTHTPLFVALLLSVILLLGALTAFPALALGPVIEQLLWWNNYGH